MVTTAFDSKLQNFHGGLVMNRFSCKIGHALVQCPCSSRHGTTCYMHLGIGRHVY